MKYILDQSEIHEALTLYLNNKINAVNEYFFDFEDVETGESVETLLVTCEIDPGEEDEENEPN